MLGNSQFELHAREAQSSLRPNMLRRAEAMGKKRAPTPSVQGRSWSLYWFCISGLCTVTPFPRVSALSANSYKGSPYELVPTFSKLQSFLLMFLIIWEKMVAGNLGILTENWFLLTENEGHICLVVCVCVSVFADCSPRFGKTFLAIIENCIT